MKNDEFAFFNHQLAGMLRDGIPLEGALRKLCQEMRCGTLRTELELLEADLARGVPLKDAISVRNLPELYRRMLLVGVQSNDLPAILILLGDYYQRRHNIWTRMKGLLVYPALVLIIAFVLSCFLGVVVVCCLQPNLFYLSNGVPLGIWVSVWTPPVVLGLVLILFFTLVLMPKAQRYFRWRFPAFRESSLAQVASAMALMLKSGVPLDDALALMAQIEQDTPAGMEIGQWRARLAAGNGKFSELAVGGQAFPPLFIWLVAQSGNDLADGFRRAAEIYQGRSNYRTDLVLYATLPCSVLVLGLLIASQVAPVVSMMGLFLKSVGEPVD
jgi:type IV pilus assembly protein PilC